ncbi:DUF4339 domain-containing protein [Catenisphaera adipataccumulans]|jgi:hypothetical protein|uniref:GYF domain-containing protein n=1 Tax=Catenisphaera adipataccumulans TaxID=700500 RepID=A0A7W8CX63_9FIRM|nr:DUF4339 domain-containing protein [Catenisphaera adipataccumulans]MBB5182956.1 hypothetical protein [Catenisphaera adipataccumulans]
MAEKEKFSASDFDANDVGEDARVQLTEDIEKNEQPEPSQEIKQWYYVRKNKPIGPLSEAEMTALIADGTLDGFSLVWKTGTERKWIRLSESELSDTMPQEDERDSKRHLLFNRVVIICIIAVLIVLVYFFYDEISQSIRSGDMWEI